MAYQPLARKYRPLKFSDLVGQDAVALALGNAIRLKREPNGVIFSGVRGVGKTTLARLYAKALNCDQGPTPEPCNECGSCRAINAGTHEDVLEIDGASNTSVEDVRNLRETVGYVTQRSGFKVYIIDEVHMLSQSAFNALLKTLEEPPKQVVFMFATTELHKVPQTIVSRCQTFYLQKIPTQVIVERLKTILQAENLEYEDQALTMIAREGHGSLRDALTLLDQVIALGGGKVSVKVIEGMLQSVSSTQVLELLHALIAKDPIAIANIIQAIDQKGIRYPEVAEQLAEFCRHGFVLAGLGEEHTHDMALVNLDDNELTQLKGLIDAADDFAFNRLFRTFMRCRQELDGSELDRFVLENYAFEWCLDPGMPKIDDLLDGKFSPAVARRAPPAANTPSSAQGVKRDLKEALSKFKSDPQPPPIKAEEDRRADAEAMKPLVGEKSVEPATTQVSSLPVNEHKEEKSFPASWRQLVERFKLVKPLQARIFEETVGIEYSLERIVVAVDEASLAGKKLLDANIQAKTKVYFAEEFGFAGEFVVKCRDQLGASKSIAEGQWAQQEIRQETILDERKKEQKLAEADYIRKIKEDPLTQTVLAEFGGEIEGVEIVDSSTP